VKFVVELPEQDVRAEVTLYSEAAPRVCSLIWESLERPLETQTSHACFDGQEIYCFLPPFGERPPLENQTMRPNPGEVMFFYAGPNDFVVTRDDRLSGGSSSVHELAFMYGETDLRHYYEEGLRGSLVGYVSAGQESFAEACARTLSEGRTALRISRGE
jgi:hypothetical protein